MAEIVSHYFPKLVELHNYTPSTSANTKLGNWTTLNSTPPFHSEKVLKKLNYQVSKNDMEHIITNTPDIIERVLKMTHSKIKTFMDKGKHEVKEVPKEVEFHKISKNQELKDILGDKDSAIKELKGTV